MAETRTIAHAASPSGFEVGVAEKTANERGGFILPDVHYDQATARVAEYPADRNLRPA